MQRRSSARENWGAARSLTSFVDASEQWGATEWWRLEIRSFDETPNARISLSVLGPKAAWKNEAGRPKLGGVLQVLCYLFSLTAPAVAALAMFRWSISERGTMPLVLAGVLTLLSLLVTLSSEISIARRPRAISMYVVRRIALVHIVPSIVVIGVVVRELVQGSYDPMYDPSLWWLAPSVIDAAVHVWQILRGPSRPGGPRNLVENLLRSVSEIDPSVRARIRQQRDDAIRRLQTQSKIDAATAQRALSTELGTLALTMAPEVRSPAAGPGLPSAQ